MTAVLEAPAGPDLRLIIDPERLTLAHWWELMGKNRYQCRVSASGVFWQAIEFLHFQANELDCCIADMDHMANIYGNKYDVDPKRFYDHRGMVAKAGLIRQVQHSAPGQDAVWQLVMPFAQLPHDIGPELARALRLDLPNEEAAEPEPEYSIGPLTANPPRWHDRVELRHLAWRPGEQAPDALSLSIEADLPWMDVETLCVARGLRAEEAHAERVGREFDPVEAEAAVRRRLLFSVIENAAGPVDDTPGQTPSVTPDPEVSPCSLVKLFPTIDLTLRKYWSGPVDNAAVLEEGRPSGGSWKEELGPAEKRRAAKVLRKAWGAWKAWQAACGHRVDHAPIVAGEWDDLVDVSALALRRMTEGELLDLVTENLNDTIADLARTVSWRLWRQVKTRPEWAGARRVKLPNGVWVDAIGRHSAAAAARLAELGAHTVRTGLGGAAARYPTLPFPTADHAPEHVQAARESLLRSTITDVTGRSRPKPDPIRSWAWELDQAVAAAQAEVDAERAAALAAIGQVPEPSRERTAAEAAANHAAALARARAEKGAAEAERRRRERDARAIPAGPDPEGPMAADDRPAPEWAAPAGPATMTATEPATLSARLARYMERCPDAEEMPLTSADADPEQQ